MSTESGVGALAGVRALEIAHYFAGPRCCQILADHGADVVKVEPPGGEYARRAEPKHDGESLYFAAHNRNKRSIALDLHAQGAQDVLDDLLRSMDVVVTNYAAEVPAQLGFDFERVWPTTWPPCRQRWGHCWVWPRASAHRAGQLIDLGMLDAMIPLLAHDLAAVAAELPAPRRRGSSLATRFGNLFPASDGRVYLAPVTSAMWEPFCALLGRLEWVEAVNLPRRIGLRPFRGATVEKECNYTGA